MKHTLSIMTVMICPDPTCSWAWEASDPSKPCPRCGNTEVRRASDWGVDESRALELGRMPVDLPKKEVCHGR